MKRYRLLLVMVLIVALSAMSLLVACGGADTATDGGKKPTKVPPVYKGMSVSEDTTGSVALGDDSDANVDVTGADYEARPGETVIVTVHFENPDQFEVLSFMLGETKYQHFMDTSTMEDYKIRLSVGDVLGMQRHVISAIKYIDGDDIEDCRLDGRTYIDINVRNEFDTSAIKLEDKKVAYDGNPHSLEVTGLPSGATCTYTGNSMTEVGKHTVTATISQEGYADLVLTAVLEIIDFDNATLESGEMIANSYVISAPNVSINNGAIDIKVNNINIDVARKLLDNGDIDVTIKFYGMDVSVNARDENIYSLIENYIGMTDLIDAHLLSDMKKAIIEQNIIVSKTSITDNKLVLYNFDKIKLSNGRSPKFAYTGDGHLMGSVYISDTEKTVKASSEATYNELCNPNIDIKTIASLRYDTIKNDVISGTSVTSEQFISSIFGKNDIAGIFNDIVNINVLSSENKTDGTLGSDSTATAKMNITSTLMTNLFATIKKDMGLDLTQPMRPNGATLKFIYDNLVAKDIVIDMDIASSIEIKDII